MLHNLRLNFAALGCCFSVAPHKLRLLAQSAPATPGTLVKKKRKTMVALYLYVSALRSPENALSAGIVERVLDGLTNEKGQAAASFAVPSRPDCKNVAAYLRTGTTTG